MEYIELLCYNTHIRFLVGFFDKEDMKNLNLHRLERWKFWI